MKRILTIITATFSAMLLASPKNTATAQPGVEAEISFQAFYDDLAPYGEWMDYPEYGYVWIPNCGADFRPYNTNGHWVWSEDYEWIWVSDYDWGWAPFHYGRWFYDSFHGWIWVPGYEWSPAWVAWRGGGDYYGWAPLRPGINISVNFSIGSYNPPVDYWCFAPRRYITSPRIYDYCLAPRNNITIINNTTIINNYNYNRNVFRTGPGRREVERYTGRINPVRLRETSSPGRTRFRNNELSVYRPAIRKDNNRTIAPHQFSRYEKNDRNTASITRRNENNLPSRRVEPNRNIDRKPGLNNNTRPSDRNINRNNNQPNTERPNRRFERPANTDRSPGTVSPGNTAPQRNERPQARPFTRNNTERQVSGNRPERNNNGFGRNEVRNNNRIQQPPSGRFNNQRPQSPPRIENRRNDNPGGGGFNRSGNQQGRRR